MASKLATLQRRWWFWYYDHGLYIKRRLLRVVLFPWRPACKWHRGDEAVDWEESPPSCPECGCLIHTKECRRCGLDFMDWRSTSWDDVMAAPGFTSSGDFMCIRCAERHEEAEQESYDEEGGYDGCCPEGEYDYGTCCR